jgi:hypothetical protein
MRPGRAGLSVVVIAASTGSPLDGVILSLISDIRNNPVLASAA